VKEIKSAFLSYWFVMGRIIVIVEKIDLVIGKERNGKKQNRSEGMERNRTERKRE